MSLALRGMLFSVYPERDIFAKSRKMNNLEGEKVIEELDMVVLSRDLSGHGLKKCGSSRISVIFPSSENQHFIYLRRGIVVTAWIYSNFMETSVVVPSNP